jgi:hypothetical protein
MGKRSTRRDGVHDHAALLHIADVIDTVVQRRASLYALGAGDAAGRGRSGTESAGVRRCTGEPRHPLAEPRYPVGESCPLRARTDESGIGPAQRDAALRRALFALVDSPTQAVWETVREVEIVPSYVPGLATPSPLGLTLADIVYSLGLPDRTCPSRADILRALEHAGEAYDMPGA